MMSLNSQLIFPLSAVKEGGVMDILASAPETLFEGALSDGHLSSALTLQGSIHRVDDEAVFEGAVRGRWRFECTRCLAPIDRSWDEPVRFATPIDHVAMELADEIRQVITLAQPMKIVCKPECVGLCPICRKNRNIADCGHRTPDFPDQGRSTKPRLTPRPQKG